MKMFKIAVGADHAGFEAKNALVKLMRQHGHNVLDFGTHTPDPSDYPDAAYNVAKAVGDGRCDRGVLACGSGIGMAIVANKVRGVRAATPWSIETAQLAAEHNWCNVLCVPSRFSSIPHIKKMVQAWLATPFDTGGRHERRVNKILKIESKLKHLR